MKYEGAVNASGRGPCIWDSASHTPGNSASVHLFHSRRSAIFLDCFIVKAIVSAR